MAVADCSDCTALYTDIIALWDTVKYEQERSDRLHEALEKLLATGDRNAAIKVLRDVEQAGGE